MYNFGSDSIKQNECVLEWDDAEVKIWLKHQGLDELIECLCKEDSIDGLTLISLTEEDLRNVFYGRLSLKQIKHLHYKIKMLKLLHKKNCCSVTCSKLKSMINGNNLYNPKGANEQRDVHNKQRHFYKDSSSDGSLDSFHNGILNYHPTHNIGLDPLITSNNFQTNEINNNRNMDEIWKCLISFIYYLFGSFLSCVTMAFSHNRVPDMTQYPPLPDIFLSILPLITWGFQACELLIIIMGVIFSTIALFHKHRLIVLKRFFAICGTIFGMRSITLTVTTLSVPGKHLNCRSEDYEGFSKVLRRAYDIMKGGGLSLNGLRTCGDYMFSGHTSYVTVLLMFIMEYSSSDIFMLHNATCVMWGFAVFFILAGHEHYTIDVVCAIYISSRIFHHYHTLITAVNFSRRRAKMWHPIFYYLEYPFVNSYVPNEYENPINIFYRVRYYFKKLYTNSRKVK